MPSKRNESNASRAANERGAVRAKAEDLATKRQIRKREIGDGEGVDIGIAPGAFAGAIEKMLVTASPQTRERLRMHICASVDEAMKPLIRLAERETNEAAVRLLQDVGPNMLRTIIECLEDTSEVS